ncbi:hypothetical protein L4Z64_000940 [Pseudomonas aeruginosa]|jgi:hypothetical protein|uniref:hypothetical protein n=1 Tax=Pseudomonas aeruginosa TaxID=287 RepID=UPI00117A6B12|nr:hypothetical protein [Pseudomonas aeruginosa]EKV0425437.1 hypothetical protein [Pseudomonas aeruginosa]EKX0638095.1 hypothetical protein [Pseudomonas aeruginosa]MBA4900085.1 hypothetical protein [Pseudomonas aeruginosa]MBG4849749.1 hypothetical protein [Pseudomonas aeruginosa]MBH9297930.1 hypothetical protein [Pseudomonas aeruginosa]
MTGNNYSFDRPVNRTSNKGTYRDTDRLPEEKNTKKRGQIYFPVLVDAQLNKSASFFQKIAIATGLAGAE